ncbi:hypothetical protein LR48_Vigan02g145100 [Vigna angularis]|uniref:Uncharacterized protein n=1 Tax=Phaseolus angularis TaxID=3914 RepID=A0A0L9TXR6_PHAAN|nr:hypothetical protein LR48_Vigan02g145100 [Vigna angularis]
MSVDKRIIFGIPIHLLKGGIPVDDAPLEPDGDRTVIPGYDWAPHDASLFASEYGVERGPCTTTSNAWAAVQAFLAMCSAIGITPTIPIFFHYFDVRPLQKGGWVSLTSIKDKTLFRPYSNSNTKKIKAYSVGTMNPVDLKVVRTINALPRCLSARNLVQCLSHVDCERKTFDIMSAPLPRKSNFMASRKEAGASSSSVQERVPSTTLRPPIIKRASFTSRIPAVPPAGSKVAPTVNVPEGVAAAAGKLTNAMLEMSTRAASMAWYLREFVDRRGAGDVRAELLVEKKVTEDLRAAMEQNRALADDLAKAKEKIFELNAGIVFEHEEALRQASVLMGVKESFALGFDMEKDVFDGVLVPLESPAAEEHQPELENADAVEQGVGVEDKDIGDAERVNAADNVDGRGAR